MSTAPATATWGIGPGQSRDGRLTLSGQPLGMLTLPASPLPAEYLLALTRRQARGDTQIGQLGPMQIGTSAGHGPLQNCRAVTRAAPPADRSRSAISVRLRAETGLPVTTLWTPVSTQTSLIAVGPCDKGDGMQRQCLADAWFALVRECFVQVVGGAYTCGSRP
jgi:hypothetical protein